jgi:hypothetical protein
MLFPPAEIKSARVCEGPTQTRKPRKPRKKVTKLAKYIESTTLGKKYRARVGSRERETSMMGVREQTTVERDDQMNDEVDRDGEEQ